MNKQTIILLRSLLTLPFLSYTLLFSLLYILLAFVIANFSMVTNIFSLPYPLLLKIQVLLYSFIGFFTQSSQLNAVTTLFISVLFGINSAFLFSKASLLRKSKQQKKLSYSAGFLSVATTGCAACGLSLFSTIGIGGVVSILPFKGYEFSLLALLLLFTSLYFNLKTATAACAVPSKK